jgi:2'-5' RNA ligase
MRSVRSFIAIECPEGIKKTIHNIQQELRMALEESSRKKMKGVNWVRPDGFHLTLKFLGSVTEDKLFKITKAVSGVAASFSPFNVSVGGVGVFPNTRVPRVIWIGAKAEEDILTRLQSKMEEVLDPLGFPRENRAFHPHLTLGRIKSERREVDFQEIGDTLAKWLVENKQRECGQFEAKEVLLMKSDLQPGGAVYTPLATLRLGMGLGQSAL